MTEAIRGHIRVLPAIDEVDPGDSHRDGAWFERLYETHVQCVFRYAAVLVKDEALAEDVTAEVFAKAWRGRDAFRGARGAGSWLLAIAHNSAMDVLRRERPTVDIDSIGDIEDPGPQLDSQIDTVELRNAMLLLTPEQREVILLRFFGGLSHEAVAARLGRNANATRATQFRALLRLRKLLEGSNVAIA